MINLFWNNRIIDRGEDCEDPYERFIITEVYYNNDNSLLGYVEDTTFAAESVEGLRNELEYLDMAFNRDVIPIESFNPDGST